MRGTSYLLAWRQTVSVCGWTPEEPHKHHDRAVEDAEGTLDLNREVDVPGGIDDIDSMLIKLLLTCPDQKAGRRRRGNGDAPLLLLLHPVHGGRAIVDLTDLVGQDPCRTARARWSWFSPRPRGRRCRYCDSVLNRCLTSHNSALSDGCEKH